MRPAVAWDAGPLIVIPAKTPAVTRAISFLLLIMLPSFGNIAYHLPIEKSIGK